MRYHLLVQWTDATTIFAAAAFAASLLASCAPGALPPGGPLQVSGNSVSLQLNPSTIQHLFAPPPQNTTTAPSYPQAPPQQNAADDPERFHQNLLSLYRLAFEQHIFERCLHFETVAVERSFRKVETETKRFTGVQLARNTPQGDFNASGPLLDYSKFAKLQGGGACVN